jgi:surface polysaccharide O-acyltransferase-like enzyme
MTAILSAPAKTMEDGAQLRGTDEASAARTLWVDLIRVTAVLSVITLHVAAVPVTQFAKIPEGHWWWANAFDSLVRPCIPLFVMVSGALLLTRQQLDFAYFFRRRMLRVAVPFIAWSALYALWRYGVHGNSMTLAEFVYHLAAGMTDPVYTHLWYLPLILSLYLLVPIFQPYVASSSLSNQIYFACLWVAVTTIKPVIEKYFGIALGYYFGPVAGYIGYFVLGAAIATHAPARLSARWRILAAAMFAVGYLATAAGTYILTVRNGNQLDEYFYSHFSPSVVIMSIGVFLLLRDLGIAAQARSANDVMLRFIRFAAMASFGVYLLHMIFLEILTYGMLGFAMGPLTFHPALAIPAISVVVFGASLAAAGLMQRIRPMRWLVP